MASKCLTNIYLHNCPLKFQKKKKIVFLILQLEGQAVAVPQENGEADLCLKGAARARVAAGCPIPQG